MGFYARLLRLIVWLAERDPDFDFDFDDANYWWWRCRRKVVAIWTFSYGGMVITGEHIMAELREGQKMDASVAFKTAAGNPAKHEAGTVQWSSSDDSIVSVEADPSDELKAVVRGVNGSDNGSAVIECRADGDPDADQTRELIFTADVVCTQGEAVVGEITFGAPTDDTGETGGGGGTEPPVEPPVEPEPA